MLFSRTVTRFRDLVSSAIRADDGFTLIELIMAMAVFSFLLVLVTTSLIRLMHINNSVLASRNTQQDIRQIAETLERQLRTAERIRLNRIDDYRTALCLYADSRYIEYAVDAAGDMWRNDNASGLDDCDNSPANFNGWSRLNTNVTGDSAGVKVVRFLVSVPASRGGGAVTSGDVDTNAIASIELSMVGRNIVVSSDGNVSELTPNRTACRADLDNEYCNVMTSVTSAQLRGGAVRQKAGA